MKCNHIVYVMTWVGICGGSKIIFQHCNELVKRGLNVTILCKYPRPNWFPLDERVAYLQGERIPKCDLVVATYWKEIKDCVKQNIAPVVYFEQGDTHLFEPEAFDPLTMRHIRKQIQSAPSVYTVSNFAKEKLLENFNVEASVIPNAIDKEIFYACEKGEKGEKIVITAIGSENIAFKCIQNIITAIVLLKKMGHDIEFIWISPDTPTRLFKIPALVNPSQKEIGDSLRRSNIFVCASLYESFCLPVLEAMTCGTAVITTDNGGVRDFVQDNVNALIIKKNNIADMLEKLELLINDAALRDSLSGAAVKTAENFSWSRTTDMLLKYYCNPFLIQA
ncbi:MAG: glycosyltransferase family 4 protein [Defluviitaleaceae bacterium]|nr:glycosyltransferase family 4 protein [Defluviitaleaceae bacterium]